MCEIRPLDGGAEAEQFADEVVDSLCSYLRSAGIGHRLESPGRGVRLIHAEGDSPTLASLAGVHRVQRQPKGGRGKRHTSTVSVAVLEAGQRPQVELSDEELEVSWFRGSGPGGQHRNTTEQAVRLRHTPTGMTVTVDGRSRENNLAAARAELARRLEAQAAEFWSEQRQAERVQQTGLPVAAGKDFTWNWQRAEVVDHRGGRVWRLRDAQRGRWEATK